LARLLLLIIMVLGYVFGGMAPNHCQRCVTPTPTPQRVRATLVVTPDTPTPEPWPTLEPWQCPPIDGKRGEYISRCVEKCQAHDMEQCGKICKDCYGGE